MFQMPKFTLIGGGTVLKTNEDRRVDMICIPILAIGVVEYETTKPLNPTNLSTGGGGGGGKPHPGYISGHIHFYLEVKHTKREVILSQIASTNYFPNICRYNGYGTNLFLVSKAHTLL